MKMTSLIVVKIPATDSWSASEATHCNLHVVSCGYMACGKAVNDCPETALGEVSILEQYLSSKFFNVSILSSCNCLD